MAKAPNKNFGNRPGHRKGKAPNKNFGNRPGIRNGKAPNKNFGNRPGIRMGTAGRNWPGMDMHRRFDPEPKEDLGLHILKNPLFGQRIVDRAQIKPTDTVLEIGPGTGNTTIKILEKSKKVICLEEDTRLAADLKKRFQGTRLNRKLEITIGDAIKLDYPCFDICISNAPYQISSPLVFKLLKQQPMFRCAVLTFQREFAMQIVARPGDPKYCRKSVNVQLYARVDHVMNIGRNNFRPPPLVEASVVLIEPINPPPSVNFKEFDGLIRILFVRKNKTLAAIFNAASILQKIESNYKTYCDFKGIPINTEDSQDVKDGGTTEKLDIKAKVLNILDSLEMSEQRAYKMEINDFLRLLAAFHDNNIHFAKDSLTLQE